MRFTSLPHTVTARQIVGFSPIIRTRVNEILPAHRGVLARLDDGSDIQWLRMEQGESEPVVGDYYVEDDALGAKYIVSAEKFRGGFVDPRWTEAAQEFLKKNPSWPGGTDAQKRMVQALSELGLDQTPSVESLENGWALIKSRETVYLPPEASRTFAEAILNPPAPPEAVMTVAENRAHAAMEEIESIPPSAPVAEGDTVVE